MKKVNGIKFETFKSILGMYSGKYQQAIIRKFLSYFDTIVRIHFNIKKNYIRLLLFYSLKSMTRLTECPEFYIARSFYKTAL